MRAAAVLAAVTLLSAPAAQSDPVNSADEPLYGLVDAAAQRLQTADPVAASKWLTGGPITDPARVEHVLAAVTGYAAPLGVPPDFVVDVFTDQIDATEAIQYSRFSWWKLDPAAAPTSAPDLSASRGVIDDLNRRMVTEIAEDWHVLRGSDCPAALSSATAAVAAQRGLDPLYRQALDAATRSYCGG